MGLIFWLQHFMKWVLELQRGSVIWAWQWKIEKSAPGICLLFATHSFLRTAKERQFKE